MAAQRYPTISKIDAIENNPEALDYAQKNLSQSPFSQRFTLHAADVDTFAPPHLFADIICNPPFYVDALPRQNATLTLALHADAGLLARWLQQATQALLPTGSIHLMLQPTARAEALALATQYHLTLQREAYLHHSPKHPPLRWLGTLAGTTTPTPPQKHWHIHESGTKAFDPFYKNLLKDFYLGF
jgi:tRNA1Val (adenine37-N6)-methyltransferase